MIINLLKTEDQAMHAKKMALTTLRVQPQQQLCPQNINARRASCKQRGTHTNHSHDKCRFKDDVDTSKTYPNIGKAPPKKDKRTNQNSSKK